MNIFSHNILILLLILFTINFICLALIRSDERFWLPSTLIWMLLLCTLFVNMTLNKTNVIEKEKIYNSQTKLESEENESALIGLEQAKEQQSFENSVLLRLTGFQTFLCLLCQLLGYKLTSRKQFQKGSIAFFVFLLIYGTIEMFQPFFNGASANS